MVGASRMFVTKMANLASTTAPVAGMRRQDLFFGRKAMNTYRIFLGVCSEM